MDSKDTSVAAVTIARGVIGGMGVHVTGVITGGVLCKGTASLSGMSIAVYVYLYLNFYI